MTTKAEWIALAESCENATKPDKWLDEAILKSLGYDFEAVADYHWAWLDRDGGIVAASIHLTASLDAITALIERELPEAGWSAHSEYYDESVGRIMRRGQDTIMRYAATPALALCAAFCRAMAEKVTHD
jgi:hypothetical protein